MASRICWHCHTFANMSLINDPQPSQDRSLWYALMACDHCGYPSVCMVDGVVIPNPSMALQFFKAGEYDNSRAWLPIQSTEKRYEDVPGHIASMASEAFSCFSISANRAAVLMVRVALDTTARDCDIESGSLNEKIDLMAQRNVIPDHLAQKARKMRFLDHETAYGHQGMQVSEDEATQTLVFLDSVLAHTYQ